MSVVALREPSPAKVSLPTVSVVIPCYRYGRFLPDCVASVLDQPGVDVRVLIIDDCSPDDSAEVAARLAAEDDRVEFRRHVMNAGHIATYNEGLLEWAEGDYSVLISADDVLTPGALARATTVLDAHPDVGFVYGHSIHWNDGEPRPRARVEPAGVRVWPGLEWLRTICGLAHSVVASPEVVVRTSVQKQVGGYLPELPHAGDLEMWLRFAAHSDVAYIKGVDQALYRRHGAQMGTARVQVTDFTQRQLAYDAALDSCSERIPGAARLKRKVHRKLAKEALWDACRAHERRRLDSVPVDELAEFAESIYPQARRLPEYRALRWRRRAPGVTPYLQPLMWSAVYRRARGILSRRRWQRHGV